MAFKLHDTYGFPIDLTADIAREEGFQVDEVGFERCMKQQIEMSKQGEKFQTADLNLEGLPETNFIGYEKNNLDKTIERGTKIEVTKMNASSLVDTSKSYTRRARQVRAQQKRRRIMIILIGIAIIVVSSLYALI